MAALNEALAKEKPPHLIGNFDGTQFIISDKSEEMLTIIKEKEYYNDPLTIVEDSTLSQAVNG